MGFESRVEDAIEEARDRLRPAVTDMAASTEREIRKTMLRSSPSGERYPDPEGGTYVASAPGEPPAIRTREYLRSFGHEEAIERESRLVAAVTNDRMVGGSGHTPLWAILEFGTLRQAARPHVRPSAEEAARGFRRAADRDSGRSRGSARRRAA